MANNCTFKFQTTNYAANSILPYFYSICSRFEKHYALIKILLSLMQGLRGKHNSNRNQYLNVLYYYVKESISVLYFFLLMIIRSVRFIHLYKYKHSSCFWLQRVLNLWFLSNLPTPMQGDFPKKPLDVPVGLLQRLDYSIVAESPPVNSTWFPLDLRNMVCLEVGAACSYISLAFFVVTIKK